MKNYTHLSVKARRQLYAFRDMKLSVAEIAKRLGKHRSTIYREIGRNQDHSQYLPGIAHDKTLSRRRHHRRCKINRYPNLQGYVVRRLKEGWSPEQIAGRLRRRKGKYLICHETIYRFIYQSANKQLYQYLRYKKPRRYQHHVRKSQCRYGAQHIITQRDQAVLTRKEWGHWEGDCIEFSGARRNPVTTLLERKSRVVLLIKNDTKESEKVMNGIKEKLEAYTEKVCKTMTFDQGGEFAKFRPLECALGCRVYFCHTHSPWEKGSNENMNGRIRQYLPSHCDIQLISQSQLDLIADRLNNIPRKCLNFRTPNELFSKHYKICICS